MTTVLSQALRDLAALPSASQRAVGAIIGAITADAATRPFHWVYKQEVIEKAYASNESLAFWPISMSPFYSIPTGRRSCYSDESVCMLNSLPDNFGCEMFSYDMYTEQLRARFSPESDYAMALALRKIQYDGSQRLTHNVPVEGPWQNQSVTTFLSTGSGDDTINESDGFCGAIPLVAWQAARQGLPQLGSLNEKLWEEEVEKAVRTLSNSEGSVQCSMFLSRLLHMVVSDQYSQDENFQSILQGLRIKYSYDSESVIGSYLDAVLRQAESEDGSFVEMVANFGKACSYPGSMQGAILTMLKSESFVSGVQKNIRGGGCNCSRANIAGALMGAKWGLGGAKGVPVEWLEQTEGGAELLKLTVAKFSSRTSQIH
jgi:ADP-ribosylglycohydrolase